MTDIEGRKTVRGKWKIIAALALVLTAVGIASIPEYELPIAATVREADIIHVSYWDLWAPRVRLKLDCNDGTKTCSLAAYRCYWPMYWRSVRREKQVILPVHATGYRIVVRNPELSAKPR